VLSEIHANFESGPEFDDVRATLLSSLSTVLEAAMYWLGSGSRGSSMEEWMCIVATQIAQQFSETIDIPIHL